MKRFTALLLALSATISAFAQTPNPTGTWLGKLEVQGLTLRIVLHVKNADDGSLQSTVDSPDQGVKDFKVDTIALKDDKLSFSVFGATYEGTFSADGNKIVGTFSQRGT